MTEDELLAISVVETALPAQLLYLSSNTLSVESYTLRQDIKEKLNVAAASPFAALAHKPELITKSAKLLNSLTMAALNLLNPDQNVHAFYVTAYFSLMLVEENLFADTDNLAVSVSLLLMDELKNKGGDEYDFKETLLSNDSKRLLKYFQTQGFYSIHSNQSKLRLH